MFEILPLRSQPPLRRNAKVPRYCLCLAVGTSLSHLGLNSRLRAHAGKCWKMLKMLPLIHSRLDSSGPRTQVPGLLQFGEKVPVRTENGAYRVY